jgi:hypothetical protein
VSFLAQRRGSLVAFAVGVTVLALYVVLQPGDRPRRVASVSTTTTVPETTTTLPPLEQLCTLAREFEESSAGQDPTVTARLAETFYSQAADLAPVDAKPEYEAAERYYAEYNNIGESYEYDFWAILGSPDGARWTQLLFREPLGVGTARANVAFLCQVELPPPPTITTTTTRPRPATTATPDPNATTPGAPGSTPEPGVTPPPATAPAPTAPAATAAPG